MVSKLLVDKIESKSGGAITFNNQVNFESQPGQVIECLAGICDGQEITVKSGTYTLADVTAQQTLTTAYADITGSEITYTPPTGTTQVIYEFIHSAAWSNTHAISHWNLYIGGVEVTSARHNLSAQYLEGFFNHTWIFPIGGTADAATGRQATWTSPLTIKMQAREYGTSNGFDKLHVTTYWNGTSGAQVMVPQLKVTAIG
jgi:hypothetical protein